MSKLFYDHLVDLSELDALIKKHIKDPEARHEVYLLIDEIIHHRVVGCILERLPKHHHKEFLDTVLEKAHDHSILEFVRERVTEDVEEFIRHEVHKLGSEIVEMFAEKKTDKSSIVS